jgi:hypothetical protein
MKTYIDANVFKFAATKLPRLLPRDQEVAWGGRSHVLKVYDFGYINPNDGIRDPILKKEADLLPNVADLVKAGKIEAVTQVETWFENWRMKNMDSQGGRFYGAAVGECRPPFDYGRLVVGAGVDLRREQIKFLTGICNTRFDQIQRAVGAYQGPNKINENQLLDAFAIWCAEFNSCEAFLSLDFSLARMVAKDPKHRVKVKILRPSEIILAAGKRA